MRVMVLACLLLCLCFSLSSVAVLTGAVVAQGGQPIAGAKLWFYRFALNAPKPELALKAAGVSGADGRFSLEDPAPDPLSVNDTWRIYALKPGLSLNVTSDFNLARLLSFTGRVLAQRLLDAAVEFAGGTTEMKPNLYCSAVAVVGEFDSKWTVEMLKAMPPDGPAGQGPRYADTVAVLVRGLIDTPERREHAVLTADYQWNWLAEDVDH